MSARLASTASIPVRPASLSSPDLRELTFRVRKRFHQARLENESTLSSSVGCLQALAEDLSVDESSPRSGHGTQPPGMVSSAGYQEGYQLLASAPPRISLFPCEADTLASASRLCFSPLAGTPSLCSGLTEAPKGSWWYPGARQQASQGVLQGHRKHQTGAWLASTPCLMLELFFAVSDAVFYPGD